MKLELIRNTMRLLHLYPYHKKTFKKEQQAEWQARMQRAAKDKKELKPSREEQEKGRALQREKAAKVRVRVRRRPRPWRSTSNPNPHPDPHPDPNPNPNPDPNRGYVGEVRRQPRIQARSQP